MLAVITHRYQLNGAYPISCETTHPRPQNCAKYIKAILQSTIGAQHIMVRDAKHNLVRSTIRLVSHLGMCSSRCLVVASFNAVFMYNRQMHLQIALKQ